MRLKLRHIQHSQQQGSYQHQPSSLIYKAVKTVGIISLMYQSGGFQDNDIGRGAISTSSFLVSATKIEQRLFADLSQQMTNQEKLMAYQKTTNHEESMMQSEQELSETANEQNGEQEKEKTATLSQETIDEAAQVTTDEAGSDAFRAMSVEDLQSSLAEANLLKQLENQEITQGSSVDSTLLEIQKLHVIEDELSANNKDQKKSKDKIDQNLIELQTLSKVKSQGGKKDRSAIEAMVQDQIQDQANQIEDTQTLQQSMDILQYGEELDKKDIVNEVVENQQTKPQEDQKVEVKPKEEKKNSTEDAEIDNSNEAHTQSQAALEDVTIKQISKEKKVVAREPLQPSKDAYKVNLGGKQSFVKAVKKAPKTQKEKIADVVKKSIDIKKKDDKAVSAAKDLFKAKAVPKAKKALSEKSHATNLTKNATAHSNKTHNATSVVKKNTTKKVNHSEAVSVKKNQTQNHVKNVTHKTNTTQLHQKNSTKNHTSNNTKNHTLNASKNATQHQKKNGTHDHKKKQKSDEEIEHESGQLDNLFLTLRESLVTDTIIVEKKHHNSTKNHTKDHGKKHLHHKGKGKKGKKSKTPEKESLLMLDTNLNQKTVVEEKIAEKVKQQVNQKVQAKSQTKTKTKSKDQDQDLDVNESADLALKKMANNAVEESKKEKAAGKEEQPETTTDQSPMKHTITKPETQEESKTETKEELPESDIVDDKKQDASTAVLEPVVNNEKQNEEKEFDKIQQHEKDLQRKVEQRSENESESKESQPETKEEEKPVKEEDDEAPAPVVTTMKEEDKKDLGQYQYVLDKGARQLIKEDDVEQDLKNLEKKPTETKPKGMKDGTPIPKVSMISLVKEAEDDTDLTNLEKRQGRPPSDSFVQLGAMSQLSAGAGAQIQAMIQTRAKANSQAQTAIQALAKMGASQKSQVRTQDANLIAALQKTIGQMQAQQNPVVSAAHAKKQAVNNIQKALTKKILTRLDDTQPLVNVFSKMQSLSKMMPQIQDFERRLGILHQVEPILENAINTLNKVVDLSSPMGQISLPKAPEAAPAPPPPPPPAPAAPGIDQLKALLANAQAQQAAAAAPPAPAAEEEEDPLAALLGGGSAAPAPAPAAADPMAGLEGLLGGASAAPALETPAFLAAPAAPAAAPAADPMAALLGGGSLGNAGTGDLLSKLLGGGI